MSERRGSCKHATTRSRREGGGGLILACDVAPLSLLDPRFTLSSLSLSLSNPPQPRSNLGYSISQLSWHQKVELGVRVGRHLLSSLSSKTRATCCWFLSTTTTAQTTKLPSRRRGQNITQQSTVTPLHSTKCSS